MSGDFPDGIAVIPWMVPGGKEIAVESSRYIKDHDVIIWAHHGMFCSGEDFDQTFGLAHTVEKAAEILCKVACCDTGKTAEPYRQKDSENWEKPFR